ncbi:hypothetical protein D3C76_1101270 [compost metagenome]
MGGNTRDHAIVEVAAIAVHFAHGGVEVEQVGFHGTEGWVGVDTVLAPAALPALALVAERPGRHDVFPFRAFGTCLQLAGFVATGLEVDAATGLADPGPLAATVQVAHGAVGLIEVDLLLGDDFGFGKSRGGSGEGAGYGGEGEGYDVQQFLHEKTSSRGWARDYTAYR